MFIVLIDNRERSSFKSKTFRDHVSLLTELTDSGDLGNYKHLVPNGTKPQ